METAPLRMGCVSELERQSWKNSAWTRYLLLVIYIPSMYGTGFFLESCMLHEAWVGNGFPCFFANGLFARFNLNTAF